MLIVCKYLQHLEILKAFIPVDVASLVFGIRIYLCCIITVLESSSK
jgi:hypothetical protein